MAHEAEHVERAPEGLQLWLHRSWSALQRGEVVAGLVGRSATDAKVTEICPGLTPPTGSRVSAALLSRDVGEPG